MTTHFLSSRLAQPLTLSRYSGGGQGGGSFPHARNSVLARHLRPLHGLRTQDSGLRTFFLRTLAPLLLAFLAACDNMDTMRNQARYDPYEASTFFPNGTSARPIPEGTVPRGGRRVNQALFTGKINGQPVDTFPFPITPDDLQRGKNRFEIYCAPCHGFSGYGNGMIVQRGFTPPPSFHLPRLREIPVGHFFDVMTNGWGAMYSYNARVTPADRWRIAAYIRALQLSQNVSATNLSPQDQQKLQGGQK